MKEVKDFGQKEKDCKTEMDAILLKYNLGIIAKLNISEDGIMPVITFIGPESSIIKPK